MRATLGSLTGFAAGLVLLFLSTSRALSAERNFSPATLIEAHEYSPCDYQCAPFNHPTTAYCFRVGAEIIVAEHGSILGESDAVSMRDLAGQVVPIYFNEHSVLISRKNGGSLHLVRESGFEGFESADCIAQVHALKLAFAKSAQLPPSVPINAFRLASARNSLKPPFVWYDCKTNLAAGTVTCGKWDEKGESLGRDRYCSKTIDGKVLASGPEIDKHLSREKRLILTSGIALQSDDRGRVNNELMRPAEACYQTIANH